MVLEEKRPYSRASWLKVMAQARLESMGGSVEWGRGRSGPRKRYGAEIGRPGKRPRRGHE